MLKPLHPLIQYMVKNRLIDRSIYFIPYEGVSLYVKESKCSEFEKAAGKLGVKLDYVFHNSSWAQYQITNKHPQNVPFLEQLDELRRGSRPWPVPQPGH